MHSLRFFGAVCTIVTLAVLPTKSSAQQASNESLASAQYGSGYAGVYPDILEGRVTTSGALYESDRLVAAHRTLPIGSHVRVVNVQNGRHVDVHIIDRGPFSGDRIMDLSERAARAIGLRGGDEVMVRIGRPGSSAGGGSGPSLDDGAESRGPRRSVRVAEYGAKTWAGSSGFTVQLGSFSTVDAAEAVMRKVDGSWIRKVEVDGQTFFRLNYGRYGSREDAEGDIAKLEADGFFGFVKTVGEGAD